MSPPSPRPHHRPWNDSSSGAVITPSEGRLVGEGWAQIYSLPLSENPFVGNGNPCLKLWRRVVEAVNESPCTVREGTALQFGRGSSWSNVEEPFPVSEAAQRAVALAADQGLTSVSVTVDGDPPVDIRRRRFELFSPQRTVRLPADNLFGVPAQTVTLTAHAWSALVRDLRPGRHTIVVDAVWDGEAFGVPYDITVVRRGHHDD